MRIWGIKITILPHFGTVNTPPMHPKHRNSPLIHRPLMGAEFWSGWGINSSSHGLNHVKNRESEFCWMNMVTTSARTNNWAFSSLPPYSSDVLWYIGWIWRKNMPILTTIRYPTMFILLLHSNYSNHSPPRIKWVASPKIDDPTASSP